MLNCSITCYSSNTFCSGVSKYCYIITSVINVFTSYFVCIITDFVSEL